MGEYGKKAWDPWKMYDVSQVELKAIQERAKMRSQLKAEWQKKVLDPWKMKTDGGHIFDPAVQRFVSMRATGYDTFKVTPKTSWHGLAFVVLPVVFFTYMTIRDQTERERRFRCGEVKYKDRDWKFMY